MSEISDPELLDSLVRIYPFCKRLLLIPWQSGDFTGTQRLVLMVSAALGRLTMTHLAESIACSKEQATRAVAPLVEAGYLQRIYDPSNRTRVLIELTDQGRDLLHRKYTASSQALKRQFSALAPEDQAQLKSTLQVLARLLARLPLESTP